MKLKNRITISLLALTGCIGVQAAQFSFGAAWGINLAGLNGQALAATDTVEVGAYLNDTFTSLHQIEIGLNLDVNGDSVNDPGFFYLGNAGKQDTTAVAGQQLAMRWTHAASGKWAILYVDINTAGLDDTIKQAWTIMDGDGGVDDNNTNTIDVANLTTDFNFNTLRDAATLVNARFGGGPNAAGYASFEIIPEPTTYAVLLGLCALVGAVLYRRR